MTATLDYVMEDAILEEEDLEDDDGNDDGDVNNHDGANKAHQEEERSSLMGSLTHKAVKYLRVIVYVVVLITAVVVCSLVYYFTKADEEKSFGDNFAAYADKLTESFNDAIELRIGAVNSLSTAITTIALATGATFPNVTIPDFELLAANTRVQAGGVLVNFLPLVTNETRAGWEAYANVTRQWIYPAYQSELGLAAAQDTKFGLDGEDDTGNDGENNRRLQEQESSASEQQEQQQQQQQLGSIETTLPGPPDTTLTGPPSLDPNADGYVYNVFGIRGPEKEGSGPFLVNWQMSPVLPLMGFLNFNTLSHPSIQAAGEAILESEKIVLGTANDLADPKDPTNTAASLYDVYLKAGQFRHDSDSYEGDPTSAMLYPVFDKFGPDRSLAGVLNVPIYWRLTFEDILPEGVTGIVCVVRNTQNQTFSYRIDGPSVSFLGPGDGHERKYDGMSISLDVTNAIQSRAAPSNQGYDSVGLDTEYNRYSIDVYPSQDTEDQYLTNQPIVYTVVVACIFFFTSLIFIAYDCLVARRQKIVMQRAVESGALVSSLYPKQIRDRLYKNNKAEEKSGRKSWQTPTSNRVDMDGSHNRSHANAEFYEESTIMFADLAGFTKWSSSKSPQEVFLLLETLYQAFDSIAIRRKVFKVETIGDCYVAVTGVPDPQEEHAAIMVKFARDCMVKMQELIRCKLVQELGDDTSQLDFRVGIHSGSITGGVLRGDKGRFQLFGDTINMASRMESNGVKGKIHVSDATALELRKHGQGHWLVQREDKINVKGKGEMSSWFVNVVSQAKTVSRSSMTHSTGSDSMVEESLEASSGTVAGQHYRISDDLAVTTVEV